MGPSGYPGEFRQRVLDLVAAGRRVGDIASDLGISDQTVHSWHREERIDRGVEVGLTSGDRADISGAEELRESPRPVGERGVSAGSPQVDDEPPANYSGLEPVRSQRQRVMDDRHRHLFTPGNW
jgi:transposase-like protein